MLPLPPAPGAGERYDTAGGVRTHRRLMSLASLFGVKGKSGYGSGSTCDEVAKSWDGAGEARGGGGGGCASGRPLASPPAGLPAPPASPPDSAPLLVA